MDMDTYSDDMTSPDYISSPRGTYCAVCKLADSKIEGNLQNCKICLMDYCDSCSSTASDQCNQCASYLIALTSQVSLTLSSLKHKNLSLIHQFPSNTGNSSQVPETTPKNPNSPSALIQESLTKKRKIIELDSKIEKLSEELKNQKLNQNQQKIRKMTSSDLFIENSRLRDIVKEFENEQLGLSLQLIDALEVLKVQIERERKEKCELEKEAERVREELKTCGGLEKTKEISKDLQEELGSSKLNLQKLRNCGVGFETLNQEEDPAGPNCKCIIY